MGVYIRLIEEIIAGWIVKLRMQYRMRKSLGRKATDRELISLNTWMQVDEMEKQRQQTKSIRPR